MCTWYILPRSSSFIIRVNVAEIFINTYFVVIYSICIRACHGSWADAGGPGRPARPGPSIFRMTGRPARPGPSTFYMMGRGPARRVNFSDVSRGQAWSINISDDGPRPGPAHHIFKKSRPGPAHHMAARPMRYGLYMGRPDNYVGRTVKSTGRPMFSPVLKGACA